MRSTGIEPVSHPWKGGILPLNHERLVSVTTTLSVYLFSRFQTQYITPYIMVGQPSPPPGAMGATGPSDVIQLSPLVMPSQVRPAAMARWQSSR
jgi:hypothetical protein